MGAHVLGGPGQGGTEGRGTKGVVLGAKSSGADCWDVVGLGNHVGVFTRAVQFVEAGVGLSLRWGP